ncbi:hypothetical protein JTB14_029030 [Gonioctena quinquepunctata]|nr:hypothetical protein JTB14_029030 [Gonioctena quinquepunctata]
MNFPLSELKRSKDNLPITEQAGSSSSRKQKHRSRIWKQTEFTNKSNDYPCRPDSHEVKTPLLYFKAYFNEGFFENLASCTNLYHIRETGSILNTNSQEMQGVIEGPAAILGLASLGEMQLHGTGTIILNRVHNHKKLDLKKDSSMKVASVKWRDPRAYLMASDCTGGDQTSTTMKI